MKIIDIINGPWAVTPEKLNEIRSIYIKHMRGEKINIKELEAQTGKTLQKKEQGYEVINNTAIIPIEGVIAKRMNLFTQISGGVSTHLIERDIRNALNDSSVEKIILYIDSPGGTIDGTFELANFIFDNRGQKSIIAYTDGMMLSAAYAIGAAADAVFISGDTTSVGSIGIVAAHEDISKYEENIGIKTTEIYSGKFKRIASQHAPLSDEGRKTIQDDVDYLYSIFINEVAKFRGTTSEDVLTRMSTDVRRIFIGHQAITAGLVDNAATLERLINSAEAHKSVSSQAIELDLQTQKKEEEKPLKKSKLAAFQKDGQDIKAPVSRGDKKPSGTVDPNLPVEEKAKAEWDKDPDLRAEFRDNFNTFLAFKKADEAGSVKIYGSISRKTQRKF